MSVYIEKNRKTKRLIQKSFLQILEEKSFEAITVGDIASVARINRGTFYLHYKDKFDLLAQMEQQLFEDFGDYIRKLQSSYLSERTFEQGQENLADALFTFIKLHAGILKLFLSDHGRAGFHHRFRDAFSEKVRVNLEQDEGFHAKLNVPMEYFLAFITSAFLGLMEQWITNDFDKTPQEMTVLYRDIIAFIRKS